MANNNIGHIKCPLSGHLSVVRADKRGKLYYFSQFGKITPNLPQGQQWLREKAVLWPDATQPENIRLETLYAGAPPVVTITQQSEPEKPLTEKGEQKRPEKALTGESVTPKRKKSALSWLLEDDDDE
ncbi:hypothetical protein [Thalassotalea hakodatensis]|uniref:hypothetical protein n=1 Tax=Thalassotalea hakodatensis TaxID=3030492 RepID=UPI002573C264|nr:hypothetical protein [Thalassotalea hakodatensis]